jgi:vacuolar-type H+-ATPase subunit H
MVSGAPRAGEEWSLPQLRDFLERFRPAGAPGAAASAGVPADRSRELEAELGPVLALLEGVDAECARIVARARHDAGQIIAAARDGAAVDLADVDQRARSARDEVMREILAVARAEAAAAVADAARQASRERKLAGQRIPALVATAVGLVRELGSPGRDLPADRPGERGTPAAPP